jgi:hypothetical protein
MSREIAKYFLDSGLAVAYYRSMRIRKDRAAVAMAKKRMIRMTAEERSEVARLGGLASGKVRRLKARKARKAA